MASTPEPNELIDVVVRLPRDTVETILISAFAAHKEAANRRLLDAKALIASRQRRATCFAGVRFYDPSWEMILALYVATREGRVLSVSQLCSLSGTSTSTSLRHLEHLEALGYVGREANTQDRRRANVTMLPPLLKAAEAWLDLRAACAALEIA